MFLGGVCIAGAAAISAVDLNALNTLRNCAVYVNYIPPACFKELNTRLWKDFCEDLFHAAENVCVPPKNSTNQFEDEMKMSHLFTGLGCILGFAGITLAASGQVVMNWCVVDDSEKALFEGKVKEMVRDQFVSAGIRAVVPGGIGSGGNGLGGVGFGGIGRMGTRSAGSDGSGSGSSRSGESGSSSSGGGSASASGDE
jgi:hypothetical protein